MRIAVIAAAAAVILSTSGIAAFTSQGGVPHYPGTPARAHSALGPVQVLAAPAPDEADPLTLAQAARDRFGEFDALVEVRRQPLPWAEGAIVTAQAVRWKTN